MTNTITKRYVGRFAPSPSGPLHMGSLVCALASYLEAKTNSGQWLVRMEDIDPPREQKGAADTILHTLRQHQLFWDEDVRFQSTRTTAYETTLELLAEQKLSYRCRCTRARLKPLGHVYDGHCRNKDHDKSQAHSVRINIERANESVPIKRRERNIVDALQGQIDPSSQQFEDFIIKRKDQLYAYQLAVVVDDIDQGVTHIVRGYDLFDCTRIQDYFCALLGGPSIEYMHIPVLVNQENNKLSKQNHAPAVNNDTPLINLHTSLVLLGQNPPNISLFKQCNEILDWAIAHWDTAPLNGRTSIFFSP